jgi:hypothetical protein
MLILERLILIRLYPWIINITIIVYIHADIGRDYLEDHMLRLTDFIYVLIYLIYASLGYLNIILFTLHCLQFFLFRLKRATRICFCPFLYSRHHIRLAIPLKHFRIPVENHVATFAGITIHKCFERLWQMRLRLFINHVYLFYKVVAGDE